MYANLTKIVILAVLLISALIFIRSPNLLWSAQARSETTSHFNPKAIPFPEIGPNRLQVTQVAFLGVVTFTPGYTGSVGLPEVGGLSAMAYDRERDVYYLLSDDRGQLAPARFYTATIAVADGDLAPGDVVIHESISLKNAQGNPFPENRIDPEGMAWHSHGHLFISSEGVINTDGGPIEVVANPFVDQFSLQGRQGEVLTVPQKFIPVVSGTLILTGCRSNLAFESLSLSPDEAHLYTAVENALTQDGPAADLEQQSPSRIIQYDIATGKAGQEFVYVTDPVAKEPILPGTFRTNGLVDVLAMDNNGTFLALERSFSFGKGYMLKLYQAYAQGALDVSGRNSLYWDAQDQPFDIAPPLRKELLLNFSSVTSATDNLEGMTFGPQLADGRQTLILVSDNNFAQETQFMALALTLERTPLALPTVETPRTLDTDRPVNAHELAGDSNDPAIWVHPTAPEQSLIIATLKDGGLASFDLDGQVRQVITPAGGYGGQRFNNVDLIYDFSLDQQAVDLAVASDHENDTLAVFSLDPTARILSDVTSAKMTDTIFGMDDGSRTAYGLAAYKSLETGQSYVFVSQRDGNQVAQLELVDDGSGRIEAHLVRTLTLPLPTGDPKDSQAEGMVVDEELGHLYLAMEEQTGVLKFPAEPDGGDTYTLIHPIDSPFFSPDIGGLSLYFGPNGTGCLLVSSQSDSTYAVLERQGSNAYVGSFAIGDHDTIDQANQSDGAAVINLPLGAAFPDGLMVVQDGANDPQNVVEDDGKLENNSTNFKLVPWQNIANLFSPTLVIDPYSYNPRHTNRFIYLPIILR